MAPSLSPWDISVATIPSNKGSDIPPTPPTVDLRTKSARGSDGYWVSYFFISSQGFFIVSLYHHLHVFTWLCKNWFRSRLEGVGTLLIYDYFLFVAPFTFPSDAITRRVWREPVIKRASFPDLLSTKGFRSDHSKIITGIVGASFHIWQVACRMVAGQLIMRRRCGGNAGASEALWTGEIVTASFLVT